MKELLSTFSVCLCFVWLFSACETFCDCEEETEPCLFSYDSVAYTPEGTAQQRMASPAFENSKPQGTFSATPGGLVIDSLSGNININASQPGVQYTVAFTLADGQTKCTTKILINEPETAFTACNLRYEKDFYIPYAESDPVQQPVFDNSTKVDGTFTVAPAGLDIDPATGIFNVDISEAGLTYTITYTARDGSSSCQTRVTIAGVDYPDTLIDVSQESAVIMPVINGSLDDKPAAEVILDPEGAAAQQGLAIQSGGAIDVRATLQNLDRIEYQGQGLPSGYSREFEIEYIYQQDGSSISNTIDIVIYWYESESAVPDDLLQTLGRKTPTEGGKLMHRHPLTIGVNKYQ